MLKLMLSALLIAALACMAALSACHKAPAVLRTAGSVHAFGPYSEPPPISLATDGREVMAVWRVGKQVLMTESLAGTTNWTSLSPLPLPPQSTSSDPQLVFVGHMPCIVLGDAAISCRNENGWRAIPFPAAFYGNAVADGSRNGIVLAANKTDTVELWMFDFWPTYRVRRSTLRPALPAEAKRCYVPVEPSLSVDRMSIHVLWAVWCAIPKERNSRTYLYNYTHIFHARSTDFGRHWKIEEMGRQQTHPEGGYAYSVFQSQGNTVVAYDAGEGCVRISSTGFGRWSACAPLAVEGGTFGLDPNEISFIGGSKPIVVWADNRFHEEQWWAKVPVLALAKVVVESLWLNNDVFVRYLETNKGTLRITQPLSFTNHVLWSQRLQAVAAQGLVYVLRTGRDKVGSTLDQFGQNPKVYLHVVKEREINNE